MELFFTEREIIPQYTPGQYAQGSVGNPLAPPATHNSLLLFSQNLHGRLYEAEAEIAQAGFFDFFSETPNDEAARIEKEKDDEKLQNIAAIAIFTLVVWLAVK